MKIFGEGSVFVCPDCRTRVLLEAGDNVSERGRSYEPDIIESVVNCPKCNAEIVLDSRDSDEKEERQKMAREKYEEATRRWEEGVERRRALPPNTPGFLGSDPYATPYPEAPRLEDYDSDYKKYRDQEEIERKRKEQG